VADLGSQVRVTADDWQAGREQLNAILSRLQSGALILGGMKLDLSRTSAPTDAPGPGDPNFVVVNVAGTYKFYLYDGSAWIVVGTQM